MKIREYKDSNYKAIFFNGKTIRQKLDINKPFKATPTPEILDIAINSQCFANCFVVNTPISTPIGIINIQDINIDDIVISYNEKTSTYENKKVYDIFKNYYKGILIEIVLENDNLILCTPNHKFLTLRGWIRAEELIEIDEFI